MNTVQDLLKEMEKPAQLEEKKSLQNQNRRRRKSSARTLHKTQRHILQAFTFNHKFNYATFRKQMK